MKEQEEDEPGLIDQIKEYARVRKDLALLTAADKASQLFANMISNMALGICCLFTLITGSFACGFMISEKMGNTYSGFFIVAGFYLLIALIVLFTKDKYLEKPIANAFIKKVFKERNEDIDDKKEN